MAAGFGSARRRTYYVVPAIAGGALTGTGTANFSNLKKSTLVNSEVAAFMTDDNRIRGIPFDGPSGGATSSTPDEFQEAGEELPYILGGVASTADITVSGVAIRYDDDNPDGLHDIAKLTMKDMKQDAEIAVLYKQSVTGLNKDILWVYVGQVTSTGEVAMSNPDTYSFAFRPTSRNSVLAA